MSLPKPNPAEGEGDILFLVSALASLCDTFLCTRYLLLATAKSDSDFMFCLQRYKGLIIDRSFVY